METSLPVVAPACPTAPASSPVADVDAAAGGGPEFGDVLGAVKLTPEQQQALADILTGAGATGPEATSAGTVLPAAAMAGLTLALGLEKAGVVAGPEAEASPEITALLALLESPRPTAESPESEGSGADAAGLDSSGPGAQLAGLLAMLAGVPPVGMRQTKSAAEFGGSLDGTVAGLRQGLAPTPGGGPATSAAATVPSTSSAAASPFSAEFLAAVQGAGASAAGAGEAPASLIDRGPDVPADQSAPVAPGLGEGKADAAAARLRAAEPLPVPFGERGWERALGERVVWLVGQQIQAAEVRLNPPHLGPVEFRLTLNGNEASVSFAAASASVRDAIEQALPRLREMLSEQNLVVVDVNVGQRGTSGQPARQESHAQAGVAEGVAAAGDSTGSAASGSTRHYGASGLVDEYA
jgi:hypothetical protein